MVVRNGFCCADKSTPVLKIIDAKRRGGHELEVLFSTGEHRIFKGRQLLVGEVFAPLADENVFNDYRLDYETLTWLDGEVDVAPEFVYEHSEPVGAGSSNLLV